MKAYRYVVDHDYGHAPNYDAPVVTLALCKPSIRRRAAVGDLIVGFQGRKVGGDPHAVRWAGIVSERLPFADYWNDTRFDSKKPTSTNRGDNIYFDEGGRLRQIWNRIHSPADAKKDLGGTYVLCLERAWRFDSRTAQRMPAEIDLSIALPFRRGHRVTSLSKSQLDRIVAWFEKIDPGSAGIVAPDLSDDDRNCGNRRRKRQPRCGCASTC